jgi:hypothetical protein
MSVFVAHPKRMWSVCVEFGRSHLPLTSAVTNYFLWAVPWHKRLVTGFPHRQPGFDPRSSHVGLVVDKVALEQVSSEYFEFPCQFSFHQTLHHHLSSGAGTRGQLVTEEPSGLSLTPPHGTKKEREI